MKVKIAQIQVHVYEEKGENLKELTPYEIINVRKNLIN